MNTTPDTIAYMIAGYVVIIGALGGYTLSLVLRWRRLKRRGKMLNEIGADKER